MAKAVTRPGGVTVGYRCDQNGNVLSTTQGGDYPARTVQYDASNRPVAITAGAYTDWFNYDSNGQRAFERLRHNVERHLFPQVGRITVSIGFTELKAGDTPNGAFERADKAVYFAKGNGRNQLHHHADLVAAGHLADDAKIGDVELF